MKNNICLYEYHQVCQFLSDIYSNLYINLDENLCFSEGWIEYLKARSNYPGSISDPDYWQFIYVKIEKRYSELRHERNKQYSLESRLSLNSTPNDYKEEIINFYRNKSGDFTNGVTLWDYARRLGPTKYRILKLMYWYEEDSDIIKILHISENEYIQLKKELQIDFIQYINI